MEKTDLLSIAPTPFAEYEVNAQTDALSQSQRVVQGLGLQSRRLTAIGRKLACLSQESFQYFHRRIHCCFSVTPHHTTTVHTLGFVARREQTLQLKFNPSREAPFCSGR
jgi:hypothetical protein